MKNIKLFYLSILIVFFTFFSCTNTESIVQEQQTVKSLSAKSAMAELKSHFNDNGTLSRSNQNGQSDNPTGNILFDYCFDFEYPVTFSYNTGTSVTVNNFDGLIDVLVNMTDLLYIDGIVFPFNVIVFDDSTNAVQVQTIDNENEFVQLIDSCGFDEDEECLVIDVISPVCVEIQDPSGESFMIQFPNISYAICEGFTQADVVECDDIVNPEVEGNECFDFDYPISIISYNGVTVIVNSDDEWESAMYTMMSGFDFVYPFDVVLLETQTTQTITTPNNFYTLIESCDSGQSDCSITNLTTTAGDCNDDGTYNLTIDFDTNYSANEEFNLVFEMSYDSSGTFTVGDLPLTINNVQLFNSGLEWISVSFSSECIENTSFDMPNCDIPCWEFVYPIELQVNGVDRYVNNESEFDAIVGTPSVQYQLVYPFQVAIDDVETWITSYDGFDVIGGWDSMCE